MQQGRGRLASFPKKSVISHLCVSQREVAIFQCAWQNFRVDGADEVSHAKYALSCGRHSQVDIHKHAQLTSCQRSHRDAAVNTTLHRCGFNSRSYGLFTTLFVP